VAPALQGTQVSATAGRPIGGVSIEKTTHPARLRTTRTLAALALVWAATAAAAESHLDRPLQPGPAYVFVAGAFGGVAGGVGVGHSLGILLRPLRASDLIPACYAWNSGLLLQVDALGGGEGRKIVSGDLVLRRYQRNLRRDPGGHSAYLGFGCGLSRLGASVGGGNGFSLLTEVGLEHEIKWRLVVSLGAQYRLYRIAGRDDAAWSLEAGVALPVSL
jgi:hypothetical protein